MMVKPTFQQIDVCSTQVSIKTDAASKNHPHAIDIYIYIYGFVLFLFFISSCRQLPIESECMSDFTSIENGEKKL